MSLIRFGLVTDFHYADSDPKGTCYYRQSLEKMKECVELMNDQRVDFLVELGDFKDVTLPVSKEKRLGYLQAIEAIFRKFKGPTYHVLGSHDTDCISQNEFLAAVTHTATPNYTLKALVEGSGTENNSYAIADVKRSGDIFVTGYRRAVSRKFFR